MTVKFKIREKRKEKGMSLTELARLTAIEEDHLTDVENNKIPADEILFAEILVIADTLECSILDLYDIGHLEIKGIGEF